MGCGRRGDVQLSAWGTSSQGGDTHVQVPSRDAYLGEGGALPLVPTALQTVEGQRSQSQRVPELERAREAMLVDLGLH